MIRAVVFDLGGVLEIGDVIDNRVRPAWLDQLCTDRGWDDHELTRRFRAAGLPGDPPHDQLQESYRTAFDLDAAAFEIFWNGFWDWYCGDLNTELWQYITTELAGRFRLGILSNSGAGARIEEEARYGLSRVFDPIVYSHEIGIEKPDPAAFAELSRQLDLPYRELCFVDNVPRNVQAAEALGITGVLHTEGRTGEAIDRLRMILEPSGKPATP